MSDKVRVHEIAKELGIVSKEVVDKALEMGLNVKTASSTVSMEDAENIMNFIMGATVAPTPKPSKPIIKKAAVKAEEPKVVEIEKIEETVVKVEAKPITEVIEPSVETSKVTLEKEIVTENAPVVKEKETPVAEKIVSSAKEAKKPLIKEVVPIKRSGLRIKKKRRPVVTNESLAVQSRELNKVSSYGKMSSDVLAELANKKQRKRSSKSPTQRKSSGREMNIFGNSMSDVSMDYEEDQVVLLDLNEVNREELPPEQPRKPRPKKPAGRGGGQKQGGNRKPRQVSRGKRKTYGKPKQEDEIITHVEIPEDIRVYEFAEKLKQPISEVIKVLFTLGMMVTKNDFLGKDEIEILAEEFEVEVTTIDPKDAFNYEEVYETEGEEEQNLQERPPVITIMGHVDHGKTSLLDSIREARVATSEAGGITQHIGAYTVEKRGKKITFLDTPGHSAFTAMRARGAKITDIIIIVVAADDGVKPQTEEAIKHAKEAGVPVIVAINKMDKESANPELVKGQMAERDMTPVDWGGETEFIPVSAKTGEGIDELLENILLTAEVLELKANPDAAAKAVVVESTLEKGRGAVATVIVQNGTLNVGDNVVCGSSFGRVKAMIDNHKKMIKRLGASETAVIVGLNTVPGAGET
ncbi:MAG: translation initiation factor IF-2, partial [Epsilonproteobacteria bacterium]